MRGSFVAHRAPYRQTRANSYHDEELHGCTRQRIIEIKRGVGISFAPSKGCSESPIEARRLLDLIPSICLTAGYFI